MSDKTVKGVGIGYLPNLHENTMKHLEEIDFIEVAPEHFIEELQDHSPFLLSELQEKASGRVPVTMHGIDLSIASDRPMDDELLVTVKEVGQRLRCPWYSEHLSFTHASDVEVELYMPPIFSHESIAGLKRSIDYVTKAIGLDFHFENVASLFQMPTSELAEWEFIHLLSDEADCGIILNLDSIAVSAVTYGLDPIELVSRYPLDRIESITIVPEQSMNVMLRQFYGKNINSLMWKLLDFVVPRSSAQSVLIQRRYAANTFEAMRNEIQTARDILRRYNK